MNRIRKYVPAIALAVTTAFGVFVSAPVMAGDPVPGVDVLLEQIPGGQIYTAQTDADGNIIFANLPPGQYRVFQDVERPAINVSGPATFTPSDGDDIGTLTVTGRAPVVIDRIVARSLNVADADRADAIPMAESLNSTRSNTSQITAPVDISAEDLDPDAIPMAESLNSGRSNSSGISAPVDITPEDLDRDAIPMAESLNSARSNTGNEVDAADISAEDVVESAVRDLLRNRELRELFVSADETDEESEAADDQR